MCEKVIIKQRKTQSLITGVSIAAGTFVKLCGQDARRKSIIIGGDQAQTITVQMRKNQGVQLGIVITNQVAPFMISDELYGSIVTEEWWAQYNAGTGFLVIIETYYTMGDE